MTAKKARRMSQPPHQFDEDAIIEAVSSGSSVTQACNEQGISHALFFKRVAADNTLRNKYIRAREARADLRCDQIQDVLDDVRSGKLTPEAGRVVWQGLDRLMQRESPKRYSERVDQGGGSDGGADIQVIILPAGAPVPQQIDTEADHPVFDLLPAGR